MFWFQRINQAHSHEQIPFISNDDLIDQLQIIGVFLRFIRGLDIISFEV